MDVVVFDRNNEGDLSHDEIWDDTLLVQRYDQAMARVKNKLAKKLQGSKASEGESEVAYASSVGDACSVKDSVSKGNKSDSQNKKKKKRSKKKIEWHTGDACRARYTGDGYVYEATIVSMQPDHGTCRVRYVGYENEEELPVRALGKSKGEDARRKQVRQSNDYLSVESDLGEGNSSMADSDVTSDAESDRLFTSKTSNTSRPHPPSKKSKMAPPFFKMPPPPPVTGSTGLSSSYATPSLPQMPPPPAMLSGEKDAKTTEALHTMLMSWYMTGYHTGYYQAIKEASSQKHTTF